MGFSGGDALSDLGAGPGGSELLPLLPLVAPFRKELMRDVSGWCRWVGPNRRAGLMDS